MTPPPTEESEDHEPSRTGGGGRRLGRTLGLAAGVLAVVLVTLGALLTDGSGDAALVPPPAAPPLTRSTSTPSTGDGSPTPQASQPSATPRRSAGPRPAMRRTAAQQAAGLRADGSTARVPHRGSGDFDKARRLDRTSAERGRLIRFDVAVEEDLDIDPDQAALLIASILDDKRSWRGLGVGRFTLVPAGRRADIHAFIATPATTDRLCRPYRTFGRVSCQNGNTVVLNAKRWVSGSPTYGDDVSSYRRYLVNHEFGHTLGRRHVSCPHRGRPAPVMVQQTKGLGGCRPNPWPRVTDG